MKKKATKVRGVGPAAPLLKVVGPARRGRLLVISVDVSLGRIEIQNLLTALTITLQRGVDDIRSADAIVALASKLGEALKVLPPALTPPAPPGLPS